MCMELFSFLFQKDPLLVGPNYSPWRCSVRSTLLRSGAGPSWGLICKMRVKVLIHSSMSCSLSAASTKYVTSFIFSSKACFRSRWFFTENKGNPRDVIYKWQHMSYTVYTAVNLPALHLCTSQGRCILWVLLRSFHLCRSSWCRNCRSTVSAGNTSS